MQYRPLAKTAAVSRRCGGDTPCVSALCAVAVLIFSYSYSTIVAVMVALGVAKGLRTVYWVLVVPDYVPIERLPAASGLLSVTNGLVFMSLGPLVGE